MMVLEGDLKYKQKYTCKQNFNFIFLTCFILKYLIRKEGNKMKFSNIKNF